MTPREFFARLTSPFRRDILDQELAAEMETHLQFAIEENLQRGMSPQEAERQARISFGGPQQSKETHRDSRGLPALDSLLQDLRFALRVLVKSPSFTVSAVLTLALGIGATTAIFSVVYGVLLRPLPYRDAGRIVRLWEQNADGGRMNFADPNFEDMRSQSHSLQSLAEYSAGVTSISGAGEASRTMAASVSRDFFSVLGVQPVIGRGFASEEQKFHAAPVVLVSYGYWQQSLGGARDLSAIHLKSGDQIASVIGVLPPGFRFPDNTDIWEPREIFERYPARSAHNWNVIGKLRDGTGVREARSELATIAARLKQQYGQETNMVAVAIEPLRNAMTDNVRPALLILFAASGFLLLIACANVFNLMLAQAAGRERELSIRTALGAGCSRLVRQFLTESFLLSAMGGALGILLAYWLLNGLLALAPSDLPRLEDISINVYVFLFSLSIAVLVSVGLGIFTALRVSSRQMTTEISQGSRSQTGTPQKQKLRRLVSAGQLATALVLLIGAGLLGKSLFRVLSVDPGFRTNGVLTMELLLPDAPAKPQRIAFLNELLTQIRAIPGVEEVGGASILPLSGPYFPDGSYVLMNPGQITPHMQDLIQRSVAGNLDNDPALLAEFSKFFDQLFQDRAHVGDADYVAATEGFFKALEIPLLRGRLFDDRDTMDAPHVALISQSLAEERWPRQDPLGRTIEFGNMDGDPRLLTVIGVVKDVRDAALENNPRPTIYVNVRQRPQAAGRFTFLIRTSGKPDAIFAASRKILRGLDPSIPPQFRALSQIYSSSLDSRRFSLTLVAAFSLAALLLALVGIYGVTSYSVTQRVREIGVRMTLGASGGKVLGMILSQGALTAAIGVVFGILGSVALTHWIQSQLFGVSPTDPVTFLVVASLTLLVSLVACWVPGRRATRVDPAVALRYE